MENIVEKYYNDLGTTTNAGLLLARFYGELTSKVIGKAEVILFNRLIRVFGRFTVFFSILDYSSKRELLATEDLYPYLYAICRDRFEKQNEVSYSSSTTNLNKVAENIEKEINKMNKHKIKIPDSSVLETGDVDGGNSI